MTGQIHSVILARLKAVEPDQSFTSHGSRIKSSSGHQYFAKLGSSSDHEQWAGEAASLKAMNDAAPGIAPQLFAFGTTDNSGQDVEPDAPGGRPYFISSYSDHGGLSDTAATALGKRLGSEMHQYSSPNGKFGFEVPTYCGATRFSNGWYDTWAECYSAMIGEMLGYLKEQGRFQSLQTKGQQLRERYVQVSSTRHGRSCY
jgi:protein-ribulosamine 3-kinase